jgi:hypothetical protein
VNAAGRVVRTYSSADRVLNPDPARDPEAYDRVCQQNPKAPDCNLPLYWAAPSFALPTSPGMHRITWDLRYDPIVDEREDLAEDESGNGAVPHRTFPAMDAPWAPAGKYIVRLTGGGKRYEQPLTLKLDPRVTTPAAGLAQLSTLSTEMYDNAVAARAAYTRARALRERLEHSRGAEAGALAAKVDALAPAKVKADAEARRRRHQPEKETTPTLESVGDELMAAAMAMQGADIAPSSNQIAACRRASASYRAVLARWNVLEKQARAVAEAS